MLLSIIGVLQKLLAEMNRLKNPVVFVLICLVLRVDPKLGNHSNLPSCRTGQTYHMAVTAPGGWTGTRAAGSDEGFCQLRSVIVAADAKKSRL